MYLFPGEGPKSRSSVLEGEESDLDQLVATATEVHVDMMSEECSEGSTDNDDFCILEAPGIGIPVSPFFFFFFPQTIFALPHSAIWILTLFCLLYVIYGI